MLIAKSGDITFYPKSAGYENHAPALLGSGVLAHRLRALSGLTVPQPNDAKAIDLHVVALTDPDQRVRHQAALRLLDLISADTGCFHRNGATISLAQGCAFDKLVRFCLNPPIVLGVGVEPRLGREAKGLYDSRHGLVSTRMMVLRALQSRKDKLGPLRDYLQQEVDRLHSAPQFSVFTEHVSEKGRAGRVLNDNLLRLSLQELPQLFRDEAFSPLARLMMLYIAGYIQATTWNAKSEVRLPYSSVLRGCETALRELGEVVPELDLLSNPLKRIESQAGLSRPGKDEVLCYAPSQRKPGVLERVAQICTALRTRLAQILR